MTRRAGHKPTAPCHGFSLVELMVVMAICVSLMGVMAFIYSHALKAYREGQSIQEVFETSRIFNRDLRDCLGSVVPVQGAWIKPIAMSFGASNIGDIDDAYLNSGVSKPGPFTPPPEIVGWERSITKQAAMKNDLPVDFMFSKAHFPNRWEGMESLGYWRGGDWGNRWNMDAWNSASAVPQGPAGWWMPGFFGKRDGNNADLLKCDDVRAGSWGWPRPDYRLDVDLDDFASHNNVACWFYAENRRFSSPYTLALDNANIVLTSIKFSKRLNLDNKEETQLTFLRHQIVGFDTATAGLVKEQQSLGNMLRAIKITPYYCKVKGGPLQVMDDDALGCTLSGAETGSGVGVPRCFDVEYTLRSRTTQQPYRFGLRIFCYINPR